jgi:hypothetical protein
MYRPYLYKVLHYPELANGDDVANSVRCLKVPGPLLYRGIYTNVAFC